MRQHPGSNNCVEGDSRWRNRSEFLQGRQAIIEFLTRKWQSELEYRLIKELWAFNGDRIAVRFAYEWHDAQGAWFRAYGNENWAFEKNGLMRERHASINDVPIHERERKFLWDRSGPVLKGRGTDVQEFADYIIAERGVRHGHVVYLPADGAHTHGRGASHSRGHGHRRRRG